MRDFVTWFSTEGDADVEEVEERNIYIYVCEGKLIT